MKRKLWYVVSTLFVLGGLLSIMTEYSTRDGIHFTIIGLVIGVLNSIPGGNNG